MSEQKSSSVESVLLKMQTSLACTICLDLLNNPLTTKCGHTFCKLCLDRIQTGPKNSFPCPLCLTPITRRAVAENAKITALVLAVRNVIASIKEDCGFQEPIRNIPATSQIESVKEVIAEDDAPIRRTTRHVKPVSYYADEIFPLVNKRKSNKRTKDQEELTHLESIVLIEDKNTECTSKNNGVPTKPTGVTDQPVSVMSSKPVSTMSSKPVSAMSSKPVSAMSSKAVSAMSLKPVSAMSSKPVSAMFSKPVSAMSSKPQINKVEQWLSKNESINFGKDDLEEDLISTQVFNKPLDAQSDSVHLITDAASNDACVETMCPESSQASTVIFNEDIVQKDSEIKSLLGRTGPEKDIDEEYSKEETNSMVSEKENDKNAKSVSCHNERRRGNKRILFEPNKLATKKINLKISENEIKEDPQTNKIPSQFMDLQKSFQNDPLDKCLDIGDVSHTSISARVGPKCDPKKAEQSQHPNSKGHNIRFAKTINLKSVEKVKPTALSTKGRAKKSPGWSRIEGARRDLRSKHTSLNILGGEQKVNSDSSKLDLSKLNIESSQESVVVIEEDHSQTNKPGLPKRQRKFPNALPKRTKFQPSKLLSNKTAKVDLTFGNTNTSKVKDWASKEVTNDVGKIKATDIVHSQCSGKVEAVCENTNKIPGKLGNISDTLSGKSEKLCNTDKLCNISDIFSSKNKKLFDRNPKKSQVSSLHTLCTNPKELGNQNSGNKDLCEDGKELYVKENSTRLGSSEKICNQITVPESKIITGKVKTPALGISRLSRKKFVSSDFIDNDKLSSYERIPNLENKKVESASLSGNNGSNIGEMRLKDSQKESKLSPKENISENIVPMEEQEALNELESKSVSFRIHGKVGENSKLHHSHSIPCDLFHMLVKYSKFLSEESQKCPCPNYNEHQFLNEKVISTSNEVTNASEIDAPSSDKVSSEQRTATDNSAVPDSCVDEYEQEVAIILPDNVSGTSLKFKNNLTVNLKKLSLSDTEGLENTEVEEEELNPLDVSVFRDELNPPDKDGGYEESQSSQLSASILQSDDKCTSFDHADDKDMDIPEREMPTDESEFRNVKPDTQHLTQNSKTKPKTLNRSSESYLDKEDVKIGESISKISNRESPKHLSQTSKILSTSMRSSWKGESLQPICVLTQLSGDQLSKKSSEGSPVTVKKRRRTTRRIDSSSSSSEEELPDLIGSQRKLLQENQGLTPPLKKPRIQVHSSPSEMKTHFLGTPTSRQPQNSPPPLPSNSQIDSEELRDFERYDENVWNYYNGKLNQEKNEDMVSNSKSKITEEKHYSKSAVCIDDSDEDDVIPATEEVLRNIDADIAPVIEREARERALSANFPGTIDLFSQDSVMTSSSYGLNSSVKEMFNKCNQTLNICSKALNTSILNTSTQDLVEPTKYLNRSIKLNADDKDASVAAPRDGEETVEDFSVLSTESPVLCTQQRNRVESEVETLRKKIKALEAEMNKKEAALNESKTDAKVVENGQNEEPPPLPVTLEEEKTDEFERESDLDSEELFKSAPAETLFQRGVTLRNGRSFGAANKVIKKKVPITLIGTGLSPSEVTKVQSFASSLCGLEGKVVNKWSEEVTHVIVQTDSEGMTERTLKYLLGVASGVWVVSVEWVVDSLRSNILLPEDEYEALDCTGAPGPNRGRRVTTPIFNDFQFCLVPPFEDVSMDQLQDLIKTCRGSVVKRFTEENPGPKLYVVNSEDPEKEKSELSNLRKRNKVTVGHDWIIECIGMYSLVSLMNYMIGSPTSSEISASGIPASLIHETQELI